MRRVALLACASLLTLACDPGFAVWFRNDSDERVIVQFIQTDAGNSSGTGFVMDARSVGGGFAGRGSRTWSAAVRVVVEDGCRLVWQRHVNDARSGAIVIDSAGAVSLVTTGPAAEPASDVPLRAAPETTMCLPKGVEFVPIGGSS